MSENKVESKEEFISRLKLSLGPNPLDVTFLTQMTDLMKDEPRSFLEVESNYPDVPSFKVTDFRLSTSYSQTWTPRMEFTVSVAKDQESLIVSWMIRSGGGRSEVVEGEPHYRGKMTALFSECDLEPMAILHEVFPVNGQLKSKWEEIVLEDGVTTSRKVIPDSEYFEVVFAFLDFSLPANKQEPFEFLKNDPLEKLPNMLGHTRGGSFS